jgi:hypothetical protein
MTKHSSNKRSILLKWKPWEGFQTFGPYPPNTTPLASLGLTRWLAPSRAWRLATRLATTGLIVALFFCPAARAQGNKKAAAEIPVKPVPAKIDPANTAPAPAANDADGPQTKVKVERGAGGKKVYKIEGEIVIEGKIQKPEAFYVLQKSGINYDWHELKQEFVPKILDSVTKSPF